MRIYIPSRRRTAFAEGAITALRMLNIDGDKLIFVENIIGIFSVREGEDKPSVECEYMSEPPYKSYIIAYDGRTGDCKAYFTALSVRTLLCRLKRPSLKL